MESSALKELHVLYIDFKKAFNSVPHWLIFATLRKYNVDPIFIKAIKEIYKDRKARFKVNGQLSSEAVETSATLYGENFLVMVKEWRYDHLEDSEDTDGVCPCGKQGLRYDCHLTNAKTHATNHVGTECVKWFDAHLANVVDSLDSLNKKGIIGKYKQDTKFGQHIFAVRASSNIVRKRELLSGYFPGGVPIFQPKKAKQPWIRIQQCDDALEFQEGDKYHLKIHARISCDGPRRLILELLEATPVQK